MANVRNEIFEKIKGVTMSDKLRNIAIRESHNIESLLLLVARSQLRWFGHVNKMPQERLPKQNLYAEVSRKRPVGRQQTRLVDYIKAHGWNHYGLCPNAICFVGSRSVAA